MTDPTVEPIAGVDIEALERARSLATRAGVLAWLRDGAGGVAHRLGESAKQQAFWALVAAGGAAVLGRLADRALARLEHPSGVRFIAAGDGTVTDLAAPPPAGDVVEDLAERAMGLLDVTEAAFAGELDDDVAELLGKARAALNGDPDVDREQLLADAAALLDDEQLVAEAEAIVTGTPPAPDACPGCGALSGGHELGCKLDKA